MTLTREEAIKALGKVFRDRLNGKAPPPEREADLQTLENPPAPPVVVDMWGLRAAIPATPPAPASPQTCCTYKVDGQDYKLSGLTQAECDSLQGTLTPGNCGIDNWVQ